MLEGYRFARSSVHQFVCPSVTIRVQDISPILLEVGIQKLVCGCILVECRISILDHLYLTLTSDLIYRIIVSGAYHLHYLR